MQIQLLINYFRKSNFLRHLLFLFLIITIPFAASGEKNIRIGILALRGKEICKIEWKPVITYLDSTVENYNFHIIPLDFNEVDNAVKNKNIDYLIVNPAIYAAMEYRYNINRIATTERIRNNQTFDTFGGIIFTKADNTSINNIHDLKGRNIAAVDFNSFGGWICQWYEMKKKGINPQRDFKNLEFVGIHDDVVYEILDGTADAGCIRTGILEKMAAEGKIDIQRFKIINKKNHKGFPFYVSTALYPEWPFAGLDHSPKELSKKIAIALFSYTGKCNSSSNCFGWTIPQDYQDVHKCLKYLKLKPYDIDTKKAIIAFFKDHKLLFYSLGTGFISIVLFMIYIIKLNRKIRIKNKEIEKSHETLEKKVEQRSNELKQKNKHLAKEIQERIIIEQDIKKLSLVVQQSSNIIIITDIKGIVEYVNSAFEKITGYLSDEVKGKSVAILQISDDITENYRNMQNTTRRGYVWHGEFKIKIKNGKHIYTKTTVSPIKIADGSINFAVIMEDITEQKQIAKAIEDSEIRFHQLFESLGDAVFVTKMGDPGSGKILEVNTAAETQTGYSREELIGKNIIGDLTVEGTSVFITMEREQKLIEGDVIRLTEKKRRKDGSEYWTEVIVSPFDYKGEKASLSINRDISERKKVEEELREALKKATESDRLKKAFLQNISHEIRTPMNGIMSFAQLLKTAGLNKKDKETIYSMMAESGQRMINTLDDLMEISLAETGSLKMYISNFLFSEPIREIISEFESKTKEKNLKFEHSDITPFNSLILKTDKKKFTSVIRNLLNNAIKYTPKGMIGLFFEIINDKVSGEKRLKISVKDSGIGIPEKKQKAIFERFIQADIEDKYAFQGSGLGLALSKIYVEMMNGNIEIISKEGEGSTFYFDIPI